MPWVQCAGVEYIVAVSLALLSFQPCWIQLIAARCLTCHDMTRADLDHTNDQLRKSLKDWMRWLKSELGFDSFRFDFAKARASPYEAVGSHYCRFLDLALHA